MDRLGNKSAVKLHFTRLAKRRWKKPTAKGSGQTLRTRLRDYALPQPSASSSYISRTQRQ